MAAKQGSAGVFLRGRKLLIGAGSVYNAYKVEKDLWSGAVMADWEQFAQVMDIDASPHDVGAALRRAFLETRIHKGPYPGQPPPGEPITTAEGDLALAAQFGLVSTNRLSQGLKSCGAIWKHGFVHLTPFVRGRGIVFWDYPPAWRDQHPEIRVPFGDSDARLGRALKECLDHCA